MKQQRVKQFMLGPLEGNGLLFNVVFQNCVIFSFQLFLKPPSKCLLADNPLTPSCVQVQMSKPVRNNGGPRHDNRGGGDRR